MNAIRPIIVWSFWLSAFAVVYVYAGYPLLIGALARLFGRRRQPSTVGNAELPTVSLLVAAYNEQSVIEQRVINALALDYPREKLEIVIASDGSTDETAAIVRRYAAEGVRLLDYPQRRGKAAVLNDAVRSIRGDLMLLSDANTGFDPQAARALARWFADPTVGAVCGRLVVTDPVSGKNVDSLYWRYETFLKRQESRLGALLGSNGAIYSIRRSLYQPIPANTIIDDFVIPLLARRRSGCRIIYDCDAIAHEQSAPDVSAEFRRRSRIGAGGWQAIAILWPLLNPARGWIAFTFVSHKILRWACPFFLVTCLVANLFLCQSLLYVTTLSAQAALYGAALAGALTSKRLPFSQGFRLANLFVGMNAALLVGFVRWTSTRQSGLWTRTPRAEESVIRAGVQSPRMATHP